MKKILVSMFVAIAAMVAFSACSSDNDDERGLSIDKSNLSLKVSETSRITSSKGGTWVSDNEFVATVSNNGDVHGVHVGEATVSVESGGSRANCTVKVLPQYSTYTEPTFAWGENANYIRSKESRAYNRSFTSGGINFDVYNGSGKERLISYGFVNNRLTTIMVSISEEYANELEEFIKERYQYGKYSNGTNWYAHLSSINGELKVDMVVGSKKSSGEYIVAYSKP